MIEVVDAPANVSAAFEAYPPGAQAVLLPIRELIYETAASLEGVGPLTETLKWGEPAYLTEKSKSGTTIRLGWSCQTPGVMRACSSAVRPRWLRAGARNMTARWNSSAIARSASPFPTRRQKSPLQHCIAMALSYHTRKSAS